MAAQAASLPLATTGIKPARWAIRVRLAPILDRKFRVWQPDKNKMFETFSYLPPLSDIEIEMQVEYMVMNRQVPCLEFADCDRAYISSSNTVRMGPATAGYYDNRYWTIWKLPMFGCTNPNQVLQEVAACTRAFPNAYVRLVSFDPGRQVQVGGFLVQRPAAAQDRRAPENRSVSGNGTPIMYSGSLKYKSS